MAYGILLLRVILGLSIAAHGAQKLFGSFGGGGPRGTAATFAQLRFRAPMLMALAAGLAELGGGLLLALGLLTPLAALAITVVMVNAVATVHRRNGFWNTSGGYEYNLLIVAAAVSLAATGGGRFSVDAALGWNGALSGLWWGLAALLAGAAISAATLMLGRAAPRSEQTPSSEKPPVRRAA